MRERKLPSVLFVCLGNICRSPLAQAALETRAAHQGLALTVDSAGTGNWHIGRPPDERALAEALRHGIDISHYRARQIEQADFSRFTHIFALDRQNLADIRSVAPQNAAAQIAMLMDLVAGHEGRDVIDPYFGDASGFSETWQQVSLAADALLSRIYTTSRQRG
ncbi:MAG: low molecular weight protein-tyrosine-phosphatase [Novosphingobium sp.]